jgi:hypothetical protein
MLRETVDEHHGRPVGWSSLCDVDRDTAAKINETVCDAIEFGKGGHSSLRAGNG